MTSGCNNDKYSTFIEAKYLRIQQFILNHILSKLKVYSDGKPIILWKIKCIQSECGKIRARKTPNSDTFQAVRHDASLLEVLPSRHVDF